MLKHTHIAIRVKWCKMLLGDTWWRELQSHTRSFPLACWTSLSSFYWLFWCLAFIICLLYRKWAKKWQGAYEGHVANLHLLIEIRHEGNINKSHISLFRGTVLTKQKNKKSANYCGCGHRPLATWHDMHHQAWHELLLCPWRPSNLLVFCLSCPAIYKTLRVHRVRASHFMKQLYTHWESTVQSHHITS